MTPATELVPAPRAPHRVGTTTVHRLEPPRPGTYWRVHTEVKGKHNARMRTNTLPVGTVLMLSEIELADGEPHVFEFAPHPAWDENLRIPPRLHADDLYRYFEPAPDGEAVRAAELAQLLGQMEETKRLMMSPPPDAPSPLLLAHDPTSDIGADGTELATLGQVDAIAKFAEATREAAEKQSKWIQTHSKTLGAQGKQMAHFHTERALAALARTKAQLEGVKGLLKTVENLKLYTGEGVEVIRLRDGEPAEAHERLTIYQDVLALDEECLILLDSGGLDHRHTDELAEALADPALVHRMIPAQRGMVLVRFRNNHKEFIATRPGAPVSEALGNAITNAHMNQEAQRNRLLLRDGERLWLIDAPDVFDKIDQLMPSQGEQDGYFLSRDRDADGAPLRITREHLDYARAQRAQLGALDSYGRVLILLWGQHDREGIFEAAGIPRFTNWLDPVVQSRYMHLVSHDVLIGMERPSFAEWQSDQNRYLAAGCWVAVNLRAAFKREFIPGAFGRVNEGRGWEESYPRFYKPAPELDGVVIERVREGKEGLYIDVPTVYCGYNYKIEGKTTTSRLWVRRGTTIADGVLTLDRARASDLSYYLESRKQRRAYSSYVELFRAARAWVAARDAGESQLRAELRDAVIAAGIPHDRDALDDRITDALAVVRAARRDKTMPAPGSSGFPAARRAALDVLHAALSDSDARIAAIEAWAGREGREPLRLVTTAKGGWRLYMAPTPDEHDPRLGKMAHATAAEVTFGADGAPCVQITGRVLLRPLAGEQVIRDWNREVANDLSGVPKHERPYRAATRIEGAADWLERPAPFRVSYEAAVAALDALRSQSEGFEAGWDLEQLVTRARRYMLAKSKGSVVRMPVSFVIGTIANGGRPFLLIARTDALAYAFHAGDETIKGKVRDAIRGIYKHPEGRIQELEDANEPSWRLRAGAIDEAPALAKLDRGPPEDNREGVRLDHCVGPGCAAERHHIEVTSLSAVGARLFPALAELAPPAL